jgi:hypothetical protein
MAHQLLKDLASGGERLRRCLGSFEVGSFGRDRAARGGHLGSLIGVQDGRALRPILGARWSLRPAAVAAIVAPGTRAPAGGSRLSAAEPGDGTVEAGDGLPILGGAVFTRRSVLTRAVVAGRSIVTARAAVVGPRTTVGRAVITARAAIVGPRTTVGWSIVTARAAVGRAVVAARAAVVARAAILMR